jgi:hypothetical protein
VFLSLALTLFLQERKDRMKEATKVMDVFHFILDLFSDAVQLLRLYSIACLSLCLCRLLSSSVKERQNDRKKR